MRDLKRYEEAKRLRDTGLTLKATGVAMGVSAARVGDMLSFLRRIERRAAQLAENPIAPPWWEGLKPRTKYELERYGFNSRDACLAFASDDLTIWRGAVVFPDCDEHDWWRWSCKRFPLSTANEIRAWLGVKPIAKPAAKPATAAEIERARRLLALHGWRLEPPNAGVER